MVDDAKPRVLLVDDELPGRTFKMLFDSWELVYDKEPRVALERLAKDDELFDVIFLDIVMPDLNGIMLYQELLRSAPARRDRVVFITGGALIPAVGEFLEKHHHVLKPFTKIELESIVKVYASLPLPRGPR